MQIWFRDQRLMYYTLLFMVHPIEKKPQTINKETISIDNNRTTAEVFADKFIKLKNSNSSF